MKLNGIKHIFWDLDHTLWDFDSNSRDVLKDLFVSFELKDKLNSNADVFIAAYKRINEQCWALYRTGQMEKEELRSVRFSLTFQELGFEDKSLANQLGMAYIEECPKRTKLMPGAIEVLNYLDKKYHQHIITNGFKEVQGTKQKCSGLADYFNVVVCSEEVGKKKPHPSVFEYALEKSGAKPKESVMIGDNLEVDAIGAQNIGITGIWYNPEGEKCSHRVKEIRNLLDLMSIL